MASATDINQADILMEKRVNTFGEILTMVVSKAADEIVKINNIQKMHSADANAKPQNRTLTYAIKSKQISIFIYEQITYICFDFSEGDQVKAINDMFDYICKTKHEIKGKDETIVETFWARLFEILNSKYEFNDKYNSLFEINLSREIYENTEDSQFLKDSRYYKTTPLDIVFKLLTNISAQHQTNDDKGMKAVKLIAEIMCNLNGPAAFKYVNKLIPRPTLGNSIDVHRNQNTKKNNDAIIVQVCSKLHQLFKANVIPKKYSDNFEKIIGELRNMNYVEYVRIMQLFCDLYYKNEFNKYVELFSALETADQSIEMSLDLSKFNSLKKNIDIIECYEVSGPIQPIKYTINVGNHTFGCKILKGKNEQIQSVFDCYSINGKLLHDKCWSERLEAFKQLAPYYTTINTRKTNQAEIANIVETKDRTFSIFIKTTGFGVGTEFKYITTSKRLSKEKLESVEGNHSKKKRII